MARPEQSEIDIKGKGVAQEKNPAIERAAKKYVDVRDERMALTKKEVDARAVLSNAMHEAGVQVYRFNDLEVTLKPGTEKIKVKQVDEDGEPDED